MQKLKDFQLTLVAVFVTVLIGFFFDITKEDRRHQKEINEKLLVNSATASAYSANADARINTMQTDFKEHLTEFKEWQRETREWYVELRAKQAREN